MDEATDPWVHRSTDTHKCQIYFNKAAFMLLNGFHSFETAHRVRCQNSSSMLKVFEAKQTQKKKGKFN